ncbi:hypothetical protein [Yinghuangia seranimata]|uniref:hypothetical protein n=1 Tax=Yinghuangia seranimata TaxID=408067 RepID=UPI00248BE2A4|nr:hypothetical protein [Yinghuangia seranimata]MDI2128559.1 hypothetical protein [Yinghuangia seranimata]
MTGMTRRAALRGGIGVGITVATGLGSITVADAARPAHTGGGTHLLPDYRPSQPTGLPMIPGQSLGMTLGGHTPMRDFTYNGRPHRIGVLGANKPGDAPHPIYEDLPEDPDLRFRETLEAAYGAHYSFRYLGGLRGRDEFRVQSYGVVAREATGNDPTTSFGGGMYIVYEPGRAGPPITDTLHWIQVAAFLGTPSRPAEVDTIGRANPFYNYGGLTPVNGKQVFNYHDMPQIGVDGMGAVDARFVGETFLAEDTGRRDASGKTVIDIHGGVKFGWHVNEIR